MAYSQTATPVAPAADTQSTMFATPIYARKPAKGSGDMAKKAALVGVPLLALAAVSALMLTTPSRNEEPAGRATVAATPPAASVLPPAPLATPEVATVTPAPVAATPAPAARNVTVTPSRPSATRRAAAVRATAPSAESRATDASATVPAPPRVIDVAPVVTPEPVAPVTPPTAPEAVPPQ